MILNMTFSFNQNKTSFLGLFKRIINKNHNEIKKEYKKINCKFK